MRSSFPVRSSIALARPLPVANFFLVDAFGVRVIDAFDDLIFQPLLYVRARGMQARNAVYHINGKIEAINLIEDGEFQWRVDAALLFISTNVNVVMIRAPVSELVDQ